ncbi:hypothetical protein IWW54_000589 [Coemansia sp. RSA 2705]|nr:hypothetical protein IWW54_000589 [Coemansia sp. RSA 2705]
MLRDTLTRTIEVLGRAVGVAGKVDAAARDMGALAIGEAAGPTDTPKAGRIDVAAEHARAQAQRASLSLVVVGHVDAGKSTLMGHLLYALGQVSERTVRRFEREAEQLGKGSFAYAWVLDETAEERARGVTMDVATSSFATAHRQFTLLDAPGHRDFVPNMISGASRADAAVLVVDAAPGAFEAGFDGGGQTREHAQLVRALGVRQVVVAVNKLDAVDWSAARYGEVTGRLRAFLQGCGFARDDVRFVPVGGLGGTNLARRADRGSALAAWYRDGDEPGPSLAELLDTLAAPARAVDAAFRLAAADVFRSGSGVSVGGRVVQGSVQAGDAVAVVPGGARGVVRAVTAAAAAHDWAAAGDDAVVLVQGVDALQVPAGAVLCAPARPVAAVSSFEAQIAVFDAASPITNGFPVLVHVQSASVAGSVRRIVETFDARTGAVARRRPRLIRRGATARVEIAVDAPLCLELFADVRELGRVTLRRGGETVAAGIVTRLGL